MSVAQTLQHASRVLYMSHLAIGDYIYQRSFLAQLQQAFPHLQIDVWFDDLRSKPKDWQAGRGRFLTDWMQADPFVNRTYPLVGKLQDREQAIAQAQAQGYDMVLFFASLRVSKFAKIAKTIAGDKPCYGLSAAKPSVKSWWYGRQLTRLYQDKPVSPGETILAQYAWRFEQLTGYEFVERIAPVDVPVAPLNDMIAQFARWHKEYGTDRAVIVNFRSTTAKRDYPWQQMKEVIATLQQRHPDTLFIVTLAPHEAANFEPQLANCIVFSADGIAQLAALVKLADSVLSVETATIHIAAAMGTPFVALMRKSTQHWCPPQAKMALISDTIISQLSVKAVTDAALSHLFPDAELPVNVEYNEA